MAHGQDWRRNQRIKRLYLYLQSMSVIGGGGNKMRMDTNTSSGMSCMKKESTGDTDAWTWMHGSVGGRGKALSKSFNEIGGRTPGSWPHVCTCRKLTLYPKHLCHYTFVKTTWNTKINSTCAECPRAFFFPFSSLVTGQCGTGPQK